MNKAGSTNHTRSEQRKAEFTRQIADREAVIAACRRIIHSETTTDAEKLQAYAVLMEAQR